MQGLGLALIRDPPKFSGAANEDYDLWWSQINAFWTNIPVNTFSMKT
jgi:hypothetical protein